MEVKKASIILLVFSMVVMLVFTRCANTARGPSGGPIDSIPPIPLLSNPPDKSTNFKGELVQVVFNEYLRLKDANKNFTISPPMAVAPIYRTKGKTVRVEFLDSLKKNTTYILDFGNSITDLNEGNPIEGYGLTFSTGSTLDSATIRGRVIDAFSLEPVEGSMVFLYEENVDSLPYLRVPDAIARVSPEGFFVARGLKEIPYKLVAVEDKNRNSKYEPGGEKIGFIEGMVPAVVSNDTMTVVDYGKDSVSSFNDFLKLGLFAENMKKQNLESYKREEERRVVFTFAQRNPEIVSLEFDGINSDEIFKEESFWRDTLTYWFASDSVPINLLANITYIRPDSLNNLVPFETELKFDEFKDKTEPEQNTRGRRNRDKEDEKQKEIPKIKVDLQVNQDRVVESGVTMKLSAPLTMLDTTKFHLYKFRDLRDTIKTEIPFMLSPDPQRLCYYTIHAAWETSESYQIEIDSLAMTDVYKPQNARIEKRFDTPNEVRYSTLLFTAANVTTPYIAQLLSGKKVVQEKYFSEDGVVKFLFIQPGEYGIRLIKDINGNKHWDGGSYLDRRQAEPVIVLRMEDGTFAIKLRQNSEHDLNVLDMQQHFSE
ncbi:MAG: Ig-like domain-containing protein [Prevotellaceae bacterium]|nr:Ig-like domain-containing protein [Prevotellaceae bacterium]